MSGGRRDEGDSVDLSKSGKSVMVMCLCHLVIPYFHKFTLDKGTILWEEFL
jgi:hypothetical protein